MPATPCPRCSGRITRLGILGGDDVKTMVMLLCWTGLRISDGATFDMSRVTPHPDGGANIFLRMHKTKGPCSLGRTIGCTSVFSHASANMARRSLHAAYRTTGNRHGYLATKDQPCIRSGPAPSSAERPRRTSSGTRSCASYCSVESRPRCRRSHRRHRGCGVKHYARWVPDGREMTNILRDKLSTAPKPKLR